MTPEEKIAKLSREEMEKVLSGMMALAVRDGRWEEELRAMKRDLEFIVREEFQENIGKAIDFLEECDRDYSRGMVERN